jgi:hypothetical protein
MKFANPVNPRNRSFKLLQTCYLIFGVAAAKRKLNFFCAPSSARQPHLSCVSFWAPGCCWSPPWPFVAFWAFALILSPLSSVQ